MPTPSVPIQFARSTLENARARGVNIEELLTRCGVPLQLLESDDARLGAAQFADLHTATAWAMEDEFLGYGERPMRLGTWSAMCHWLLHTRSLGQTIERCCRFYGLMERGFSMRLTTKKNAAIVEFSPWTRAAEPAPYAYELFLTLFHRLLCWMARERVPIKRMDLPYPRPGHHREYRYMFRGCPVHFDQRHCSIAFHPSQLALPVRQDLASLTEYLRRPVYEMIVQDYARFSWTARVRELIASNPAADDSLSAVARRLDTHEHTLRRRLADEGYSFVALKRQAKRDLAVHLLCSRRRSIEEIAFAIGFSEASAFIRAFKQWTGVTPSRYRKGSRGIAAPSKSRCMEPARVCDHLAALRDDRTSIAKKSKSATAQGANVRQRFCDE